MLTTVSSFKKQSEYLLKIPGDYHSNLTSNDFLSNLWTKFNMDHMSVNA